jgi:hypothetical protein
MEQQHGRGHLIGSLLYGFEITLHRGIKKESVAIVQRIFFYILRDGMQSIRQQAEDVHVKFV